MEPDDRPCCGIAEQIGEDPVGTAPLATTWVAVHVPGSWGTDPLAGLGTVDREALAAAGVGLVAVRRARGSETAPPGLLLVGTRPARTWRRDVPVDDAADVLARLTDPAVLDRLSRGEDPGLGRVSRDPAALVVVHGDPCSAGRGPAAAEAIAIAVTARRPGGLLGTRITPLTVLESSDPGGGHRFAPTAIVLPWGVAVGGLGPDPSALARAVQDVLDGRPLVDGYRGRTTYPPYVQVADAAARRHLALVGTNAGPDDVLVDGVETVDVRVAVPSGAPLEDAPVAPPDAAVRLVRLRHSGGRTIRVKVRRERTDVLRPPSCGDPDEPVTEWVTEVDADPPTQLWWGPAGQ